MAEKKHSRHSLLCDMCGQMFYSRGWKKFSLWKHESTDGIQTVLHVSLSQVSSVLVWSIKHLTINYCPAGEAADEKEQVISCWAVVLH